MVCNLNGVSYSRGPSVLTPRFLLCLDMSGGNSKNIHNYSGQVSLQKLEPYKLNLGNKSQKISPRPQVPNIHVVNGKGSKALQVRWFVGSRASKLLMGFRHPFWNIWLPQWIFGVPTTNTNLPIWTKGAKCWPTSYRHTGMFMQDQWVGLGFHLNHETRPLKDSPKPGTCRFQEQHLTLDSSSLQIHRFWHF